MKLNNMKKLAVYTVLSLSVIGTANAQDQNTYTGELKDAASKVFQNLKSFHEENSKKFENKTQEQIEEMKKEDGEKNLEKSKELVNKTPEVLSNGANKMMEMFKKGAEALKKQHEELQEPKNESQNKKSILDKFRLGSQESTENMKNSISKKM